MTFGKAVLGGFSLNGLVQPEQPELIRHGGLGLSQLDRGVLLGHSVKIYKPCDSLRLVENRQITPLNVFYKRHYRGIALRHCNRNTRDELHSQQLRRAQPSLPCHKLKAVVDSADCQRLQNSVLTDTLRQSVDIVKFPPRLIWIGIYFRGLHLNNLVKSFFLNEKRHSYALPLLFFSVIIPLLFSGKCQNSAVA